MLNETLFRLCGAMLAFEDKAGMECPDGKGVQPRRLTHIPSAGDSKTKGLGLDIGKELKDTETMGAMRRSGKLSSKAHKSGPAPASDGRQTKHGQGWPAQPKNSGGQFEKMPGNRYDGGVLEWSVESINNLLDESANIQELFDLYARTVPVVRMEEFQAICESQDENVLVSESLFLALLESNEEFVFDEIIQDGYVAWVPRTLEECGAGCSMKRKRKRRDQQSAMSPMEGDEGIPGSTASPTQVVQPWTCPYPGCGGTVTSTGGGDGTISGGQCHTCGRECNVGANGQASKPMSRMGESRRSRGYGSPIDAIASTMIAIPESREQRGAAPITEADLPGATVREMDDEAEGDLQDEEDTTTGHGATRPEASNAQGEGPEHPMMPQLNQAYEQYDAVLAKLQEVVRASDEQAALALMPELEQAQQQLHQVLQSVTQYETEQTDDLMANTRQTMDRATDTMNQNLDGVRDHKPTNRPAISKRVKPAKAKGTPPVPEPKSEKTPLDRTDRPDWQRRPS